jgi:hypothetical protein
VITRHFIAVEVELIETKKLDEKHSLFTYEKDGLQRSQSLVKLL